MAREVAKKAAAQSAKRREEKLTRERVIAEARRLLDERGPDALSMRGLAGQLGVSPMALYNHVRNKRDLIDGIAQSVVRELPVPAESGDWRERLKATFRALRSVCLANPRAIPLVQGADVLDLNLFRAMEASLSALRDAGLGARESLTAHFLLTNFTLGQVSYQIAGPFRGLDPAEAARRGMLPPDQFPLILEAVSDAEWDFDAAFEFGLEIIIEGLARGAA
jgi:TetR/AcrR family transcriptional regulator, tetracycline repressor protein